MAGAAVRAGGGSVGIDTDHFGLHIRDAIQTGDGKPSIDRRHARSHAQSISSDVGDETRSQADHPAVAPGGKFDVLNLVASMRGRYKALASPFRPGARTARAHRQHRADDVLRIKTELG